MKKVFTLFLFLVASVSMLANVSATEKEALLKLYSNTNGSQWTKKWDLKAPVSSWYGVKIVGDKVIGLDLSNNNLVGELPVQIVNLSNLQQINFFKNSTTVAIVNKGKFETIKSFKHSIQ